MVGRKSWQSILTSWLDSPYELHGTDRDGVDCSSFVAGALREWRYPSLPHSNVEMLTNNLLLLPVPLSVALRKIGFLAWSWGSIRILNIDAWSVFTLDQYGDADETLASGDGTDFHLFPPAVGALGAGSKGHWIAYDIWQMTQNTIEFGDRAPKSHWWWALYSWYAAAYNTQLFGKGFHHIAAILDRRRIIHSTITSGANGVQIASLGEALGDGISFDTATVNAFAELFGLGINLVTATATTINNARLALVLSNAHTGEDLYGINVQADIESNRGIVPLMLNEPFAAYWHPYVGPTVSDATADFVSITPAYAELAYVADGDGSFLV